MLARAAVDTEVGPREASTLPYLSVLRDCCLRYTLNFARELGSYMCSDKSLRKPLFGGCGKVLGDLTLHRDREKPLPGFCTPVFFSGHSVTLCAVWDLK